MSAPGSATLFQLGQMNATGSSLRGTAMRSALAAKGGDG